MNDPDLTASNWQRHTFHAMGSTIAVWLEAPFADTATAALTQVEALFEAHEQALSRFRPESELSQLNARSGQPVAVSDLFWDVLALALEMAAKTNGRFDPTTLNALEQHGYTIDFAQMAGRDRNNPPIAASALPSVGRWMELELDARRQTVFLPAGVRVDLGGIAKGYTAQQAVRLLRGAGPCLVDAGGDLVAGPSPQGLPGWPVAISSPWRDEDTEPADMFTLWLADEALATSGIDYRHWQRGGQMAHHLIDPTCGAPAATDAITATILTGDAAAAEAWATATMITGSELGLDWLLEAGLAGLIVTQSGAVAATPHMYQRLQPLPAQ